MNFVNCHGVKEGDHVVLHAGHFTVKFMPNEKLDLEPEHDYVLGVRPEFVHVGDQGIEATVISSLPSGMETTLSLAVKDITLSAVAFGSVDFKMDSTVHFNFEGNRYVLFDKETQNKLGLGSLEIVE